MPVLDNPQHEAFAQLVAKGTAADIAYRKCYPRCKKGSAKASASKLSKANSPCFLRIKELQKASASKNTLSMQERREFLAKVVRTPIGKIDEKSPLAQAVEYEIVGTEKTGFRTLMKVKSIGKRECVELDAKLAGEFETKVHHSGEINSHITIDESERAILVEKRRAIRERLFSPS